MGSWLSRGEEKKLEDRNRSRGELAKPKAASHQTKDDDAEEDDVPLPPVPEERLVRLPTTTRLQMRRRCWCTPRSPLCLLTLQRCAAHELFAKVAESMSWPSSELYPWRSTGPMPCRRGRTRGEGWPFVWMVWRSFTTGSFAGRAAWLHVWKRMLGWNPGRQHRLHKKGILDIREPSPSVKNWSSGMRPYELGGVPIRHLRLCSRTCYSLRDKKKTMTMTSWRFWRTCWSRKKFESYKRVLPTKARSLGQTCVLGQEDVKWWGKQWPRSVVTNGGCPIQNASWTSRTGLWTCFPFNGPCQLHAMQPGWHVHFLFLPLLPLKMGDGRLIFQPRGYLLRCVENDGLAFSFAWWTSWAA